MRSCVALVALAAACLAAEIPKLNDTGSTPAVVVPTAANGSVQLRPEELLKPDAMLPVAASSERPAVSVDSLFPDIHLHHEGDKPLVAVPPPTYVVNQTQGQHDQMQHGDNLMDPTTKATFIMKISSTPKPEPEPHPEPEPTAEPEPASKGSSAAGTNAKPTTFKPTSLPKTSAAPANAPAVAVALAAIILSRLC